MTDPIQQVKDSNGELVLDFNSRVGARPYARYVDGEWELMSLTNVPTPAYGEDDPDEQHGINTRVHTVDLEPDPEDHPEEQLYEIAKQARYPDDDVDGYPGVSVIPYEESPFPDKDQIPARDEIVSDYTCPECGEDFRQYYPEPFTECQYCGAELPEGMQEP